MPIVADIWLTRQLCLFTCLEECLFEPLTDLQKDFIGRLDVLRIEKYVGSEPPNKRGRTRCDRGSIARAFVAKALYTIPTTKRLRQMLLEQPVLRMLCGWERRTHVPSEATFSRAFAAFAAAQLGDTVHASLVRHYVGDSPIMHLSRDATEFAAREKPAPRLPKEQRPKRPRSRIAKDGTVLEQTRVEIQYDQTADQAWKELPRVCDVVKKKNSQGNLHTLIGYKLHIDWADGIIPIQVCITSASVHDSQVAIPLARKTAERVTVFYELMDQAYDAPAIHKAIADLGHVPVIDRQRNRAKYVPLDEAKTRRFMQRTNAERGNSLLRDCYGLTHLRVRSSSKALLHAMFGVLALFAGQIVKPVTS